MKKVIKYLFIVLIGCFIFASSTEDYTASELNGNEYVEACQKVI